MKVLFFLVHVAAKVTSMIFAHQHWIQYLKGLIHIAAESTIGIFTHQLNLKGPIFLLHIAAKATLAILTNKHRIQVAIFLLDIVAKATQPILRRKLDSATFTSILITCSTMDALEGGMELHQRACENGFSLIKGIVSVKMDQYTRSGIC